MVSQQQCLGSGLVAAAPGLDIACWKLLKLDSGNYQIVNKATGLLLRQGSDGVQEVCSPSTLDKTAEWKLIRSAGSFARDPKAPRELPINNGM